MDINKENFGRRLKYLMQSTRETTYSMATQFRLSPPSISRYTRGEMIPKITTIRAMASYFDVSPRWLMGENVPMYDTEPLADDGLSHTRMALSVFKEIRYDKPVFSNQKTGDSISLPSSRLVQWQSVFAYAVPDDSMADTLKTGDIAIIQMNTELKSCPLAALHVNESDMLIRKTILSGHQLLLQPENAAYDAAVYDLRKDNVQMIGSVVYCRRSAEFYFDTMH